MKYENIIGYIDHTVLSVTATWEDVKKVCDDALRYPVASICIPPSYVAKAAAYLGGGAKICTVIGFPNGYSTTEVKCYEVANALSSGADEIDVVINQGMVKEGRYDYVQSEIELLKSVCGDKVLKVIVETCNLNDEEKIRLAEIVSAAGADFIKTSTGFAGGGATFEDVKLLFGAVSGGTGVKASGGINTLEEAERFIELGATRLGTSRLLKLIVEAENCQ